jgi:hypothetical protein
MDSKKMKKVCGNMLQIKYAVPYPAGPHTEKGNLLKGVAAVGFQW